MFRRFNGLFLASRFRQIYLVRKAIHLTAPGR